MISPSVNVCQAANEFTRGKKKIHPWWRTLDGMSVQSSALKEALCDRLMLLQEASGVPKGKFAKSLGLTAPKLTNISNYRNPPSHDVIREAVRIYGVTTEWFYFGSMVGFRDTQLADRLRDLSPRAADLV